jgi:hypothetical protein
LGEPVDVLDFAQDLVSEYQLVYMVDGEIVNEKSEEEGHFSWIPKGVGYFFFNRIAYAIYSLFFLLGVGLCIYNVEYVPIYRDFFTSSSVTITVIIAVLTGWAILFFHEFGHLLAAKSLGVKSKIQLSHRLVFVVAETDMSNIVTLPHKRRYRALFAGMAWEGALFGIGVLAGIYTNYNTYSVYLH